MIELKKTKDNEYIPYPLRYKEKKEDNKQLLFATIVLSSGYLLFLTVIGLKLGWAI